MAESLARLIVTLESQTASYQRGMEEANQKLAQFGKTQKSVLSTVEGGFRTFSRTVSQLFVGGGIFVGFRSMERALERVAQKYKDTDPAAKEFVTAIDNVTAALDRGLLRALNSSLETLKEFNKYFEPAVAISRELEGATFDLALAQKVYNEYLKQGLSLESPYAKGLKKRLDEAEAEIKRLQHAASLVAKPPQGFEPGVAPGMFGAPDLAQEAARLAEQQRQIAADKKKMDAEHKAAQEQAMNQFEDNVKKEQAGLDAINEARENAFQDDIKRQEAELDAFDKSNKEQLDAQKKRIEESNRIEEDAMKKLNEERAQAAETFGDLFAAVLIQSNKNGMKQVLSDFLQTLAIMIARTQAVKLFESAAGSGGWFGAAVGAIFGGGRASGGPVAAGVPYMVGERGPEMFIPKTSGNITPNGAGAVNVYNNVTVGDIATRSQLVSGLAMIKEQTKKEVADSMFRRRMR